MSTLGTGPTPTGPDDNRPPGHPPPTPPPKPPRGDDDGVMTRGCALWACARHVLMHPWPHDGSDTSLTGHLYLRRLRQLREDRLCLLVLLWPWLGLAVATAGATAWLAVYGCGLPRIAAGRSLFSRPGRGARLPLSDPLAPTWAGHIHRVPTVLAADGRGGARVQMAAVAPGDGATA